MTLAARTGVPWGERQATEAPSKSDRGDGPVAAGPSRSHLIRQYPYTARVPSRDGSCVS